MCDSMNSPSPPNSRDRDQCRWFNATRVLRCRNSTKRFGPASRSNRFARLCARHARVVLAVQVKHREVIFSRNRSGCGRTPSSPVACRPRRQISRANGNAGSCIAWKRFSTVESNRSNGAATMTRVGKVSDRATPRADTAAAPIESPRVRAFWAKIFRAPIAWRRSRHRLRDSRSSFLRRSNHRCRGNRRAVCRSPIA